MEVEESELSAALRFDIAAARIAAIMKPLSKCGMRVAMKVGKTASVLASDWVCGDKELSTNSMAPISRKSQNWTKTAIPLLTMASWAWRWLRAASNRCTIN